MRGPLFIALLPLGAVLGCNDAGLTKFNAEPVARITSHGPDDAGNAQQLLEGALVSFEGTVSDPDDSADTLLVSWYLGDTQICETAAPAADGTTSCEARVDLDSDRVRLVVSDPENATATAIVQLEMIPTEAPEVAISAPVETGRFYAGLRITFEGTVADNEDQPEELTVQWASDLDGALDVANEPDTAGTLIGRAALSEGEHLITLTAYDTHGKSGTDAVAITVGPANRAPDCAINRPADGSVWVFGDEVAFEGLATDADITADELDVSWRSDIDGLLAVGNPATTGDILMSTDTLSKGTHTISLVVADDVEAECTDTIQVIVDTPPEVEITSPVDGTENNEDEPFTLVATVSDEQTAAPGIDLVWTSDVDGVLGTTPAAVDGTATLEGVSLSVGLHVITLTATDDVGLTDADAITLEVNGLPSAPIVSIDPDPPGSGDDLVAVIDVDAVDPDGDAVTYTYAWTKDGAATSLTTATVPTANTAKDDVWAVTVTPHDGRGTGPSATASVVVGNGAPAVTAAVVTPSSPTTNQTLTVVASATDPDGDSTTLSYEWFVNGLSTGQTGTTLDGAVHFDKDDEVWVEVVATDGTDTSGVTTTASVFVDNTAPGAPGVTVTPAAPRSSNDDIDCAVTTGSSDDDADTITYTFAWTVDGVAWTGATDTATTSTVPASDVGISEVWTCTVTPNDGDDDGPTASASVTSVKGFNGWGSTTVSLADSDTLMTGEELSDYAGWDVSGAGDVDGDGLPDLLIGAYNAGDLSIRTGMAYIIASGSLSATSSIDLADADWRLIGDDDTSGDQSGKDVSDAGDVDGDGYDDVLIGGPNIDDGATNGGGVYLVMGGDLGTVPDYQLYDSETLLMGEGAGDRVGEAQAAAGDVDGDGLADVLVGAGSNDDAGTDAGKAYLVFGDSLVSGDMSLADADYGWTGEAAADKAGFSVDGVGDLDGDGLDDLVIGAWGNDDGGANAGKVYVVLSSALPAHASSLASATYALVGEGADDYAGYSAVFAGDVDADGTADLLVGAYGDAPAGTRSGRSYLVYGSTLSGTATLDLASADHRFAGEAASDLSGIRVAAAGDVDNDGMDDLLIGAPANDAAGSNAGKVYLVLAENIPSSRNIGLSTVDYGFTGEAIGDQAGYGLAGPGDVNGDGFDDLLIGAWANNDGGADAGKAYLMLSP